MAHPRQRYRRHLMPAPPITPSRLTAVVRHPHHSVGLRARWRTHVGQVFS